MNIGQLSTMKRRNAYLGSLHLYSLTANSYQPEAMFQQGNLGDDINSFVNPFYLDTVDIIYIASFTKRHVMLYYHKAMLWDWKTQHSPQIGMLSHLLQPCMHDS